MNSQRIQDAALILFIALAILLPQLAGTPLLEPDEARYVEIPREMLNQGDYVIPRLNHIIYLEKPPFFYWLQTLSIKFFGIQEMALRFWNAFFAAFSCMMVYLAGSLLYNRRTGWLAAGLLFSSCLFFSMAHFITLDMTLSGLVTGCLFSILIALNQTSTRATRLWFYSAYIFGAFALLTKGLIGILLPGSIFMLWILSTQQWSAFKRACIPTGILIFLAITLPWHILAQMRVNEFFDFYIIGQHFKRYLTMAEQRYQPAWFFIPILFAGLIPWTFFMIQALIRQGSALRHSLKKDLNLIFLLIWPAFIFLFFSFSKSKLVPYILPVLPPLFLILSHDLLTHPRRRWEKIATIALLLIAGLAVSLIPLVGQQFLNPSLIESHSFLFPLIACLLVIAAGLYTVLSFTGRMIGATLCLAASGLMVFSAAIPLALHLADRSIKPLAQIINAKKKENDEIVAFRRYFQDLPVYTEQQVTVVDRKGELDFGMTLEDTSAFMIDTNTFKQRWENPDHRIFAVMSLEKFEETFKSDPRAHVLGTTTRYILISNQS